MCTLHTSVHGRDCDSQLTNTDFATHTRWQDYYEDLHPNTKGCGLLGKYRQWSDAGIPTTSTSMFPKAQGTVLLRSCPANYVRFSNPPECVANPVGFVLPRNFAGELMRQAVVCASGQYSFAVQNGGFAEEYNSTCLLCPSDAICLGGATPPKCVAGAFHPRSSTMQWRIGVDSCMLCPAGLACEDATARGHGWVLRSGVLEVDEGFWVAPSVSECGMDVSCISARVYQCFGFGCEGNATAAATNATAMSNATMSNASMTNASNVVGFHNMVDATRPDVCNVTHYYETCSENATTNANLGNASVTIYGDGSHGNATDDDTVSHSCGLGYDSRVVLCDACALGYTSDNLEGRCELW